MKTANHHANNIHFTDKCDNEKAFLKSPFFSSQHEGTFSSTYIPAGGGEECTAKPRAAQILQLPAITHFSFGSYS
jgi:hypothetical protein